MASEQKTQTAPVKSQEAAPRAPPGRKGNKLGRKLATFKNVRCAIAHVARELEARANGGDQKVVGLLIFALNSVAACIERELRHGEFEERLTRLEEATVQPAGIVTRLPRAG